MYEDGFIDEFTFCWSYPPSLSNPITAIFYYQEVVVAKKRTQERMGNNAKIRHHHHDQSATIFGYKHNNYKINQRGIRGKAFYMDE